ncbi:hypothetical protein [Bradyrhizobium guangzhouense]|uniref:hypothetical protein n=1 Tax=Bradyrhizobium guangzhouense TaxID=1325095 RepID=UPI001009A06D|nr:hypothetical protein [Bradyrhizobium guangzhouense]RXH15221.1 hypothetical protein EAS54_19285 [Bradyrhizobium guangzhouense]
MGIPTRQDHALAELESLHGVVMVRCRALIHAGPRRDPTSIREACQAYIDRVFDLVAEVMDQ